MSQPVLVTGAAGGEQGSESCGRLPQAVRRSSAPGTTPDQRMEPNSMRILPAENSLQWSSRGRKSTFRGEPLINLMRPFLSNANSEDQWHGCRR